MSIQDHVDPPLVHARIVALTLAATALLVSGCLGGPTAEPPVPAATVTNASGEPGDVVHVEITARDVTRIQIGTHPNASRAALLAEPASGGSFPADTPDTHPYLRFDAIALEPAPTSVAESFPPIWQWRTAHTVKITVPVQIQETTPPGRYGFSVKAGDDDRDGRVNATAWVRVREP